ncbi:MAG: biopolymer transporter ExbD [Candidatus Krumholzibacteria bacterium]|jgi:biopolymer transport protein ExbD|nr:biopolymer transporter ExbD [Candidatus Krumholzibacteria bacterium]
MIKKRSKVTSEFNTASMSDINFLLLIFFLVSTMFAVEKGLPMALPGKGSQTVKLKRDNVLAIQAYKNGSIVIRGTGPVNIREIKTIIEKKLLQNPKLVVVIETHPDADYGIMVDILDELRLAKATRISLRTLKTTS